MTRTTLMTTLSVTALLAFAVLPAHAQKANQTDEAAMKSELKEADKDMGSVLKKLQELGAKPISTLTVEQARKQPTPADAVKAVMRDSGKDPAAVMAEMKVMKKDLSYATGGAQQPIRIYTPEGPAPEGGFPVIVYYHGGGWVIADLDVYEATPMSLAKKAKAIVASVEYRHAPENKFPAAHDDAVAAWQYVIENAQSWNGNAGNVAVAGESAGGNLAVNVAIAARDKNLQAPKAIVAVYPVAGVDLNTPSYQKNAKAAPLGKADMEWFIDKVLGKPEDKMDPRIDLVGKADLKGLPPTLVITAEIDPLMSEGKLLADKLKSAGVTTTYDNVDGVSHEFFGMAGVVKDADRAQDMAVKTLTAAFGKSAAK
ncbi:MAG: hypothetical protein JWN07_2287 [Hyphomicrobiales bacterium]|nr:hypothetical protein [Hyphomicrobiales bacterium]